MSIIGSLLLGIGVGEVLGHGVVLPVGNHLDKKKTDKIMKECENILQDKYKFKISKAFVINCHIAYVAFSDSLKRVAIWYVDWKMRGFGKYNLLDSDLLFIDYKDIKSAELITDKTEKRKTVYNEIRVHIRKSDGNSLDLDFLIDKCKAERCSGLLRQAEQLVDYFEHAIEIAG